MGSVASKKVSGKSSPVSASAVYIWSVGGFLFGVLVTLLVGHFLQSWRSLPDPAAPQNGISTTTGPWGVLEALEVPLGNREDLFVDRAARLQRTSWFFENFSKEQLETLLQSCNLTAEQWGLLQQTNVVTIAPNGIILQPPEEFVWALTPAARARVYEILAKTPANYTQDSPFTFAPTRFAQRLAAAGLTPAQQARISALCYTNGAALCFSDLQLLPGFLTTNELDRVSEALYRVPAYRLRLRLYPDADVDAVVKYWGQNDREKLIRPLLESLTRVPDRAHGTSINISYLLPPTARLRLYTYPNAWPDAAAERQDCFWTSLNFFCDPPDPRYLDSQRNKESLDAEYEPVTTPPTYGDLVVLAGAAGNGLHACVYLADDYVFTKNGLNKLQPWVIMKMSDMMAVFATEKPARTIIFRRKVTAPHSSLAMVQSGVLPATGK